MLHLSDSRAPCPVLIRMPWFYIPGKSPSLYKLSMGTYISRGRAAIVMPQLNKFSIDRLFPLRTISFDRFQLLRSRHSLLPYGATILQTI